MTCVQIAKLELKVGIPTNIVPSYSNICVLLKNKKCDKLYQAFEYVMESKSDKASILKV